MVAKNDITADEARLLLDYDEETGVLTWRRRTPGMFASNTRPAEDCCRAWNNKNAGKIAGWAHNGGYLSVTLKGRKYLTHRVIVLIKTGEWPAEEVDHSSTKRRHNAWSNLREASRSQNQGNKPLQRNNKSGFKGVFWNNRAARWEAAITRRGKRKYLGHFTKPEAAHAAYCKAADEHFKEFANYG